MKARRCAGPSYLVVSQLSSVNGFAARLNHAARKTAAAAAAAKAAGKHGRSEPSAGSDDSAGGGGGAAGGGSAAAGGGGGAADRVECLQDDAVDVGLRYGRQVQACDAPARVCRLPKHWLQ